MYYRNDPAPPPLQPDKGRGNVPSQDLEDLVRLFQESGDSAVFRRLYNQCWGPLFRFFLTRKFSTAEAEDLSQNVLVCVYHSIGTFRFESQFNTWLFSIAGNEWKNELRRQQAKKRQAEEVSIDSTTSGEEDAGREIELIDLKGGPLEALLADERSTLLEEALQKLSPRERQCLILRGQKDLKYREIATVLKLSLATVKTHIVHGYRRLRPLLEQHSEVFEAQEPSG